MDGRIAHSYYLVCVSTRERAETAGDVVESRGLGGGNDPRERPAGISLPVVETNDRRAGRSVGGEMH
ncbi:MAG: hypothetical protein M3176_05735 [Chloroflexota bacterium]|nr:hypothetical protein [Chloroflexota bacterium]